MEILVDTQILIWFQLDHGHLSKNARELVIDRRNKIHVSDISLYELVIKQSIGKLENFDVDVRDIIGIAESDGFNFIPIDHETITTYREVPFYDQHRDPFDRLLVATAKRKNLMLLSADNKLSLYQDYINLIKP